MNTEKIFFIKATNGNLAAVLHESSPDKLVILAHGFTGQKTETGRFFVSAARALARAGFSVLRFDFMGSGDSSGEFFDMSPNTEIADLRDVIAWAHRRKFRDLGLLGFSYGGGVSICAAAQTNEVKALVTWSSVPSFRFWRPEPEANENVSRKNPMGISAKFFSDRPAKDIPEAYCSLTIPKLQVQGDCDIPGFREQFSENFLLAKNPKRHVLLPGADHSFSNWTHRKKAIALSIAWFRRFL